MNIKGLKSYAELKANKWTDGQINTIGTYVSSFCENIQMSEYENEIFDIVIAMDMQQNGNQDAKNYQKEKINQLVKGTAEVVANALAAAKAQVKDSKKIENIDKAVGILGTIGAGAAVVIPGAGAIVAGAIGVAIGIIKIIGSLKVDYNKDYFYYPTKLRAESYVKLASKEIQQFELGNKIRLAFGKLPILIGQWDFKKSKNIQVDCYEDKPLQYNGTNFVSYEDPCWRRREGAPDDEKLDDYKNAPSNKWIYGLAAILAFLLITKKL